MRRHPLPLAVLLVLSCTAMFTGCNCGTRTVAPPLPPLSAVTLTPVTDTLVVGQARQFLATALDTDSVAVAGAGFAWSTGDAGVCTVNNTGLVTAVGEGVTTVIAEAGGFADTAIVAVYVQAGWYTQTSSTANDLHGVFFQADGRNGCAVGDAGTVVTTSNAGATWSVRPGGTTFALNDVWFTTAQTGFAVGAGGTVMRTRNGGASWSRLLTVPSTDNLQGVCFADTAHGWVVGSSGAILRTANGGASWTKTNPTAQQLNSVSFADTSNGWAVGEGGVIVGTHDGGRSWYIVQPSVTGLALRGVWRRSNTLAWAGGLQGAAPRTSATVDSLQWTLGSFGAANQVEGVQFVNDLTGYAVGLNGAGLVLKSLDGGGTWTPQTSNSTQGLEDVWFVDALRGWAVGAAGRIVHTSRGGL